MGVMLEVPFKLAALLITTAPIMTGIVAGGLLPGDTTGYQYPRPSGGPFGFGATGYRPFSPTGYNNGNYDNNGNGYYNGYRGYNNNYNYDNGYNNGPPRPYSFEYAVLDAPSGADYGQRESGDGAGTVRGKYRVLLPDSRTQIVTYTADDARGYVADVRYEGQAGRFGFPRFQTTASGFGGDRGNFGGTGYGQHQGLGSPLGYYQQRGVIGGNPSVGNIGLNNPLNNQYLPPYNKLE